MANLRWVGLLGLVQTPKNIASYLESKDLAIARHGRAAMVLPTWPEQVMFQKQFKCS